MIVNKINVSVAEKTEVEYSHNEVDPTDSSIAIKIEGGYIELFGTKEDLLQFAENIQTEILKKTELESKRTDKYAIELENGEFISEIEQLDSLHFDVWTVENFSDALFFDKIDAEQTLDNINNEKFNYQFNGECETLKSIRKVTLTSPKKEA